MPRRFVDRPGGAWVAIVAAIIATLGVRAWGHQHPCLHTHAAGNAVVTCNQQGAACTQDGAAGVCRTVQNRVSVWCECVTNTGGCLASAAQYFSHQGEGDPQQGSSIIYLATIDPRNFAAVNFGMFEGPELGPEEEALTGTITLEFGSFADPLAVPVLVTDISLFTAALPGLGVTAVTLPDGFPRGLLYDAEAGAFDTEDEEGLEVEVSNALSRRRVRVHLGAELDAGGALVLFQVFDPSLIFRDGLESGDLSAWTSP